MPGYDDRLFSPAAPVVRATLRNPDTGKTQSDVPMLIDSGSDITLLPRSATEPLGFELSDANYKLTAFDGTTSFSAAVQADLVFLGKTYRGQYLLIDQEVGFLAATY